MVLYNTVMLIFHWSTTLSCIYFLLVGVLGSQEFYKQPVDKSAVKGMSVVLDCSVKNRIGHLQWTRDDFGLGNERDVPGFPRYSMKGGSTVVGDDLIDDFSLQIDTVTLEDDADFQCQLQATERENGIRSRSVHLTILLPPEEPQIEDGGEIISVVLGRPTNLTCLAANGKPAADVTWYMNGQRIAEGVTSTQILQDDMKRVNTISHLEMTAEKSDSGKKIECHAFNDALSNSYKTHAILDVEYAPIITLTVNTSKTMREYDYVRFTCVGAANPFNINWRWYRNRVLMEEEKKQTLDIASISRELHGSTITCEGNNTVGNTIVDHSLDIEFGPRFIGEPKHATVTLHEMAVLSCDAEGNPPPSIVWKRKGFDQYIGSSSRFTISSVDEGDFGIYVCIASVRGFSDISQLVYLLQNGAPKIVSEANQYAEQEELAKVECLVMSAPLPQYIMWSRNSEPIDYAKSGRFWPTEKKLLYGQKSTLHIKNVQVSDFGFYNCSVKNQYGMDILLIQLIEKEILPLPYIIGGTIGGITVIFIIVVACVLYHRYKSSDTESYTETESSTEVKKREKSDSPLEFTKATLMDQWRQDYNNRYSADFEDIYNKDTLKNSNGYGSFMTDPYPPEYQNGHILNDYDHRTDEVLPAERCENAYNTGCSTFRSESGSRTDFIPNGSVDYIDTYRLPPADMSTSKLATNV